MRKIILIFILIINSQIGKSQNIVEYYKSINQAELAIVDSNYAQSIIDYELAFKTNNQPIGKDIYNFAICCLLENDFRKSLYLFQRLVDLEYDTKNFEELIATDLGKKLPKSIFQQLKNLKPSGRIKLNYPLKDSLQKLYDRDQFFRKKQGSYQVYGDTIRKIDEYNDIELRAIIKNYGWPSEYLIGVNQNLYPAPDFDITIWHQTTLNHISSWVDEIKNAIWTGRLEPHRGASLIENHVGNDSYLTRPFRKIACPKCPEETIAKFEGKIFYYDKVKNMEQKNEFRLGIFLERFEDYVKKFNYDRKKNKYFKLHFKGIDTSFYDSEEYLLPMLKRYLENYKVLD